MDWLNLLPFFLLVFVRITAFFVAAPILMMRDIPVPFKVGLAFFLALITLSIHSGQEVLPLEPLFWLLLLKEVIVGLCLGFTASLILYAVQVAGIFIDMQIGFTIANVMDPQTGVQTPITGRLKYVFAILLLLSLNGHHLLIRGIFTSFEWIAVDAWIPALGNGHVSALLAEALSHMFQAAFLISIPIAGTLFLVDVALGIVAKTVPQMNVFVVGLPLKMLVNFMLLLFALPALFFAFRKLFADLFESMLAMIRIMGG
ncbi:flagellar biosynthetic protein FliR [Ammoniphilus oxalaticus]|uniref:Flagellar biosynthetic protein FliR n=1 Tax=Ammoniphilus oxalaticus TaxID=66863 RepID=A0A419SJY4_9BACL|nr:flagellar biosynthetic protein FliR [Ammoniphilus oxalaticus]RKD24208.1 flagellar biosynthetic protein FliR [Ammoniphilus oxalaticus]